MWKVGCTFLSYVKKSVVHELRQDRSSCSSCCCKKELNINQSTKTSLGQIFGRLSFLIHSTCDTLPCRERWRYHLDRQLCFLTKITTTSLRLDILVWSTKAKSVLIIEKDKCWGKRAPNPDNSRRGQHLSAPGVDRETPLSTPQHQERFQDWSGKTLVNGGTWFVTHGHWRRCKKKSLAGVGWD